MITSLNTFAIKWLACVRRWKAIFQIMGCIVTTVAYWIWSGEGLTAVLVGGELFLAFGPVHTVFMQPKVVWSAIILAFLVFAMMIVGLCGQNVLTPWVVKLGFTVGMPTCPIIVDSIRMLFLWRRSWSHWIWHPEGKRDLWVEKCGQSVRLSIGWQPFLGVTCLLATESFANGENLPVAMILAYNALVGGILQTPINMWVTWKTSPEGVNPTPVLKKHGGPVLAWSYWGMVILITLLMTILLLAKIGSDGHVDTWATWLVLSAGFVLVTTSTFIINEIPKTLIQWQKAYGYWPWEEHNTHKEWGQRTFLFMLAESVNIPARVWLVFKATTWYANRYPGVHDDKILLFRVAMNALIQIPSVAWKAWRSPRR